MLVLGRKQGERILIGDDIVITVVSAGGSDGVRIGIDAPRHVRIHRAEVLERVAASNQAAVAAAADTKATLPLLASKPALADGEAVRPVARMGRDRHRTQAVYGTG